jgi:hypothetical protein
MIGARASPGCELCKSERQQRKEAIDNIPAETVAHIQSAGCKAQKKSVIGAHNRCWKYLLGAIFKHGEAKRDVEFIGEDKDRQLESLWKETRIGDVLPWEDFADEAQTLLDIHKASMLNAPHEDQEDGGQENDQEVDRDETDPYNEVIFGEEDLTQLWLIGPTRSCSYWNSSLRRIKDEITEDEGNLERGPSMASSSEASRR